MMRYSSEEEKEIKEFGVKDESCMKCFFFTKNPLHDQYRCHCGSCPALKKW